MATIIKLDKRTGITYAYESTSKRDKVTKKVRVFRTLIGKVDMETGKIIPTDGRCKHLSTPYKKAAAIKEKEEKLAAAKKAEAEQQELMRNTTRTFCGATHLLDSIAAKTGVDDDLRRCFPRDYKEMFSIAYFLIMEDANTLNRFSKWALIHEHPAGHDIPSQRASELFERIDEEGRTRFFRLQAKRRCDDEYQAYDSTTISSYLEMVRQVRRGRNKDHEPLPQLNLLILFGEQSNLPFYYRKLAGNIPDVKTVDSLLKDVEVIGVKKPKLVMGRGFYSKANIDKLYSKHYKFLVGASTSLGWVGDVIDEMRKPMRTLSCYDAQRDLYCTTKTIDWEHADGRNRAGEPKVSLKRMYVHVYFNVARAAQDKSEFIKRMAELRSELLEGKASEDNKSLYNKYFKVKKSPDGKITVEEKTEAFEEAARYYGYFVLIGNEAMDAKKALSIYRNRDVVEKSFTNVKERLNCNRLPVSSERALDGKLFVHFIALILLSYIQKQMRDKELFGKYTLNSLLEELDCIELLRAPGHRPIIREILTKQTAIYDAMDVPRPDMSW